ncbi:MAG: O-antigen ligase [Acidobacteriaceae bacterium]
MTPRSRPAGLPQIRIVHPEDLACAALFAFFAMQGSIPGIAPAQALEMTASAPNGLTTIGGISSQAIAYTLILALILRRPRLVLRQTALVPWAGLLAVLAVASTAWSLDPLLTLRRSLPFALAGLFGLWFSARFTRSRQLAILRLAMIALALATIAIVVRAPSIGLDHSPGHAADWQGVFTQKNACGRIMVLATAVILFGERITASRLTAFALFLFVLIMSGSRAAWMIEGALVFLWLVLSIARRAAPRFRLVMAVTAPFACVALGTAMVLGFHRLALLLSRDPTLSGRTAIWAQVGHFIVQHPLLGYGYDAFWRGATGPSLQIDTAVHFFVVHAHNGFLEIALELGAPGLALFVLSWLRAWRRLWPLWRRGEIDRIAWPLAIVVLIALYDLDENTLLLYNGLFWILYVAALASIENTSKPTLGKLAENRGPRQIRGWPAQWRASESNGACPEQVRAASESNG